MKDYKKYFPIIKWKGAEQKAIKKVLLSHRDNIFPVLQIVLPKQKDTETVEEFLESFEEKLKKYNYEIKDKWSGPAYIDVSLLPHISLKEKTLDYIFNDSNVANSKLIPVMYIRDDNKLKNNILQKSDKSKNGICIKITPIDLDNVEDLSKKLEEIIKNNNLSRKNIDILIDIKELAVSDKLYSKYFNISQKINSLNDYRNFIFAGGSFPKDLSECTQYETNIDRQEWNSWLGFIADKSVIRMPSFSDYTTQHPIYNPDSQFHHPTTSIRYTLDKSWLILKGKQKQFDIYLASASLLSKDKRFLGKDFSEGDKYIYDKGEHFPIFAADPSKGGTGNTSTWIEATINHHLSFVSQQISNLP